MGLKVWLPLTKDLHNQGTSQVTVTNNGATYSASGGKLGGCYNFNGSDNYLSFIMNNIISSNNSFSVCSWVKIDGDNSYNPIFFFGTSVTNGVSLHGALCNRLEGTDGAHRIDKTFSTDVTANTWCHVTITYNGMELKYYCNGMIKDSISWTYGFGNQNNITIGSFWGPNFKGKMNDFRIYDNCLSPQEVAEIAKGLVVHYPLERRGLGNENLFTEPYWSYSNSKWVYATTGASSPTIKPALQSNGDVIFTGPGTQGNDQCYMANSSQKVALTEGKTYTISVKLTAHGAGYWRFWWYDYNDSSLITGPSQEFSFADGETKIVSWTRTLSANTTHCYWELNMIHSATSSTMTMYAHSLKLEEGSIATPWCPNSSDTLATTLGFNSNIEYDGSGLQNNGTRTGTFAWSSDVPPGGLYPVSTVFGSGKQITGAVTTPNALSATIWIKDTGSLPSSAICFRDDVSHLAMGIQSNNLICGASGGNEVAYISNFNSNQTYKTGQWNHIAIIKNNDSYDIYINGIKQTLSSPSSQWSAGNPTGCLVVGGRGGSDYWPGKLSDLRIYATALSANDIKSLYQNEAYVDTNGTVYGAIR